MENDKHRVRKKTILEERVGLVYYIHKKDHKQARPYSTEHTELINIAPGLLKRNRARVHVI